MAGLVRRRSSAPLPPLPLEAGAPERQELIQPQLHWRGRLSHHDPSGTVCLGSARIDNRRELLEQLELNVEAWGAETPREAACDDTYLIHRAWLRWGEACCERIYGDWAFAIWNEQERSLFLARDHFGITSLYYVLTERLLAFATEQSVLIDLQLLPYEIDELYVAQVLVAWPAYHGRQTVRHGLHRLPPAHRLTVTRERDRLEQYWHLERTPPLKLRDRRDYVAGFLEVFDQAVRCRLRRDRGGLVGSTLSGGLDSGSISATAARMLAESGEELRAFTSVPIADTSPFTGRNFGDEWPFASATAATAGIRHHQAVDAAELSPMAAIQALLAIHREPSHAAGNAFWMLTLNRLAREAGCSVLLIGQSGNAGLSWAGSLWSQPLGYQLQRLGEREWLRLRALRSAPAVVVRRWRRWRLRDFNFEGSALAPAAAERLQLKERMLADPNLLPPRQALQERRWLMPGRSVVGALHAQMARAAGLEIRDPSSDARLLAYTWSVPDAVFIDPKSGEDRWLIRTAMHGRLPDQVRCMRRMGIQAGDLTVRLRREASTVEACLRSLESSERARSLLDLGKMRKSWQINLHQSNMASHGQAASIVCRGAMVGMFLRSFQQSL
jgi:asparagine synthase (glutamine-hydrolysing)